MTSGTLTRPEPAERPEGGPRRWNNPLDPKTTLGRQRIIGALLFLALFGVFFSQNRFPKLDTVREDLLRYRTSSPCDVPQPRAVRSRLLGRRWLLRDSGVFDATADGLVRRVRKHVRQVGSTDRVYDR